MNDQETTTENRPTQMVSMWLSNVYALYLTSRDIVEGTDPDTAEAGYGLEHFVTMLFSNPDPEIADEVEYMKQDVGDLTLVDWDSVADDIRSE